MAITRLTECVHRCIAVAAAWGTTVALIGIIGCRTGDPSTSPVAPQTQGSMSHVRAASPQREQQRWSSALPHLDPTFEKAIADRVEVREDATLFALYAMLDVAGHGAAPNGPDPSPLQRIVHDRLHQLVPADLRARIQSAYRLHKSSVTPLTYTIVALTTSGPPSFTPEPTWIDDLSHRTPYRSLAWLPGMLGEFNQRVPIADVYREVQPEYAHAVEAHRAAVRREAAAVAAYTRVKKASELEGGEHRHSVIVPNLLQPAGTTFSFALGDTFYNIEGLRPTPNYDPHEFVHAITHPICDEPAYVSAQAKAGSLFREVESRPAIRGRYRTLAAFLDENLVRAILLRRNASQSPPGSDAVREAVLKADRDGYLLVRFFYHQLDEFERGNLTLREFYPQMLANLDPQAELERWRATIEK